MKSWPSNLIILEFILLAVVLLLVLTLAPTAHAMPKTFWYRVQKNESLDSIIKKLGLCSTRLSCIALKKDIKRHNPSEVSKNGNLVYESSQLVIPLSSVPVASTYSPSHDLELVKIKSAPVSLDNKRLPASVVTASKPQVPVVKIAPPSPVIIEHPLVIDHQEDQFHTALEISPFYSMNSISSTDSTTGAVATIVSKNYIGADFRYVQIWNPNFRTFLNGNLSYISFDQSAASLNSLSTSNLFLSSFGLGMSRGFGRFTAELYVDAEKEVFMRGLTSKTVAMDSVLVPSTGLKLTVDLMKRNSFHLDVSGIYELKFYSTTDIYKIKQGALIGGTLGVGHQNELRDSFRVNLSAKSRKQQTSSTSQTEMLYTLSLQFSLGFGENKLK